MFDTTYRNRSGFDPTFLSPGGLDGRVLRPRLNVRLSSEAVPLLSDRTKHVLDYHYYSVVMHRTHRFAIFSAANVDFNGRFEAIRPRDVWRTDPRIPATAQVMSDG